MSLVEGSTVPIGPFALSNHPGHVRIKRDKGVNQATGEHEYFATYDLGGADGTVMDAEVIVVEVFDADGTWTGAARTPAYWQPKPWCEVYATKGLTAALYLMVP